MNHHLRFLDCVENREWEPPDNRTPEPFVFHGIKFWIFQDTANSSLYTFQELKSQTTSLTFIPNHGNINIDFEYAIYDCETDEMAYGKYIGFAEGKAGDPSELKFRKIEDLAYYFGVFFPTKPTYILRSMNLWIISSLIILTALGFFIYAIFIILRQKRLSEIQKDFINNMTHEFKTPISSIGISAGVLQEKGIVNDSDRLKTYAAIIAEQNLKLEDHIERVLQSASMEKHSMQLQMEDVEVCNLIADVVGSFHLQKGQEISIDCSGADFCVKADRAHFTNLIYNLIDNAVKYSGADAKVIVGVSSERESLQLFVQDNGPGINKKYHKKIFKRFFRIPEKNINAIKGFGLGLNYVKYVVRAHKWRIMIDSDQGKGSRFVVTIA